MIRSLAASALLVGLGALARDAGACSCMPPDASLLSPDRIDDAPTNARVRVELPTYRGAQAKLVLRVHGGADVDVRPRKIGGGSLDVVELVPVKPLVPDTRFEVATIDPQRHPATHVLGTFKTAKATTNDATPPRIDKLGAVVAEKSGRLMSSCAVPGPWVIASELAASDPGRPNAKLVYGVWLGDAAGNIDAAKPPTRILPPPAKGDALTIGASSGCAFHDFPLPTNTASVWLGLAALDEAGNASAMKKVKVDLQGARVR